MTCPLLVHDFFLKFLRFSATLQIPLNYFIYTTFIDFDLLPLHNFTATTSLTLLHLNYFTLVTSLEVLNFLHL